MGYADYTHLHVYVYITHSGTVCRIYIDNNSVNT